MLWEVRIDSAHPEQAFASLREAWRSNHNRVFVIRGDGLIGDVKQFYTDHFGQIGTPHVLAEDATIGGREAQRSGEIWMEVRYDPTIPDAYRHSANAQPLHTDGSYIPSFPNATLMACVANAGIGGETTFIDGTDVIDALRSDQPELLRYLSQNPILHARSGDERTEFVIDQRGEKPLVNWNYYCLSKDLSDADRAATQDFFEFLQTNERIASATLSVKLNPGDAVTWKDREVLHGRNGFEATQHSERFLWKCAIDVGQFEGA